MDFFVNLIIGELKAFYLKILVMPTLAMLLLYIVYVVWLKVEKAKNNFIVHSKMVLLKSINLTIVLYNLYWIFLIKANGILLFSWSGFSPSRNNIYVMLLPTVLGYFTLIYAYFKTQNQIKKLL